MATTTMTGPAKATTAAAQPASALAADLSPDLTLKSRRQRKVELGHEASLLNKAGRLDELQRCLETILELDPQDAQTLYNLALLASQQEEKAKAERFLLRAIRVDPDYIDAYQALGDMFYQARHLFSAIESYERGLRQVPTRLPLLAGLLQASATMRSAKRVEGVARRILNIDDQANGALTQLAWALMRRDGDLDEAQRSLERALEIAPEAPSTLALAESLAERRGDAEALQRYRARLNDVTSRTWKAAHHAAETFVTVARLDRAAAVVQDYLKSHPDDSSAYRYLAVTLMQDGDFVGGHAILKQTMEVAGDRPGMQMVYALNAFRLGDLETFYRYHHSRWARDGAEAIWKLPVPEWDGKPIEHGKLVLQCEQGVGDLVMYAVCFPGLAGRARDVIVRTMPRLFNLFRRSFPEMQFIKEDVLPPDVPIEAVAARAACGDLPMLLGGAIDNLPGKAGILVADPVAKTKLRKRYEDLFPGKRLVGISWRSGNRDSAATRSLELPFWKPLFDLPDYAFISLQYGDISRDIEELKQQLGDRVYWDAEINPMGDMDPFTAQISAMDLVVSVDNSTVHFAGGLGKPCWAMLPLNSDWRWQTERTDTVWYDSVELIRPDKEGGWDGVIEHVAQRLAQLDDAALKRAETAYLERALDTMTKASRTADAEQYGRMLLTAGEHKGKAMRAIGRSAAAAGQAADAVAILHRASELEPDDPDILADLAGALAKSGEADHGFALARDLTRRFPTSAAAAIACGRILSDLGRFDEATDFFARVLRREPNNVESRIALAGLQAAQGDVELAHKNYKRVLEIEPANSAAHTALAEMLLRQEDWQAGWGEFRWRYGLRPGLPPPSIVSFKSDKLPKVWSEGSLRKQRVFLSAERNRVEQVLFAGLVPEAEKESRKLVVECDSRLLPVMQASFPGTEIMVRGSITEEGLGEREIQLVSSLGDLAARFRADRAAFPSRARPYLSADPTRSAELRDAYEAVAGGRMLIGLSWRHSKPSPLWPTPLEAWLPLADSSDVLVVALHPGPCEADLAEFEKTGRDLIYDRSIDVSRDFGDYAAQIAACDFVIAVEDLTAALAAAMAKPTVKVRKPVDHWWWGLEAGPSRWYPTLQSVMAPDGIGMAQVVEVLGIVARGLGAK